MISYQIVRRTFSRSWLNKANGMNSIKGRHQNETKNFTKKKSEKIYFEPLRSDRIRFVSGPWGFSFCSNREASRKRFLPKSKRGPCKWLVWLRKPVFLRPRNRDDFFKNSHAEGINAFFRNKGVFQKINRCKNEIQENNEKMQSIQFSIKSI